MPISAHASPARNAEDLPRYASVKDVVEKRRPTLPIYAIFPSAFRTAAQTFIEGFPGEVSFAVKCNPAPHVLATLGIRYLRLDQVDLAMASIVVALPLVLPLVYFMMKRLSK